jgi:vitamin B12 transporter
LKKLLFHIALLCPLISSGQIATMNDTIRIKEVTINSRPFLSSPGNTVIYIDSSLLKDYNHNNISEVISENTPIFIKNYGSGGIATISIRGTGAGYTQFAWNGVNLNSAMLGQTDLSLIPAGFIDDVSILYGGASLTLNSGGMGGIVNVETKPVWTDETNLYTNLSIGSFGKYSALLKAKTGNKNFQSSTKALIQTAENNYPYLNNFASGEPVPEKRKNAGMAQKSFMQELYFRSPKNVFSARFWYQKTDRNIPVPIVNLQPDPGESQSDEFLRTMINFNGYRTNTDYYASLSWFSEKLVYLNPLLSINSINLTNTITFKTGFDRDINNKTRISLFFNDEISTANSVNYNGIKSGNMAALTVSARRIFGDRAGVSALLRQAIKDNKFLIPDFSTGFDYRVADDREYFIKLNVSHNSKIPTLNDLYWNPGGSSSLKNEYSFSGELSYEMNGSISPSITFNSQLSMFLISIDNMIKWLPGTAGYWTPSNITKANTSGGEFNAGLNYTNNSFKLKLSLKYALNRAHVLKSPDDETGSGKQIIYVPENMFTTGLRAGYRNYYISWILCYTGKRYTTTDNSEFLPDYFLNNVSAGIKLFPGKNSFDINLKVDNLFNINYQAIAWYPMPGRSFILSIIYQFVK